MIKCEQLAAGYGGNTVIHGIDWSLADGKLTVIVGPNGSGKSTLLKAILGQAERKGGRISLEGRSIGEWSSRDVAKRVAYLPQNRNDANISVFRMVLHGRFPYIEYPRHYTREDEEAVLRALQKMGIEHLKGKPVSELSGGEKQKAYLAMALVQDSPVLLLDEPATYLDICGQLELMRILRRLTREGKTVAAVLHDLNFALQYGDEMLLMEEGRLVQKGTCRECLESGSLERVFGIRISCLLDEDKKPHYCFS